ncbi:short-chain dehydrogenase [Azorhizobium oxalatiphilum]|uniref:Short-chain dehydrogenase n=1 Tax=Azorhizobium oxalatiphilum TaxID=980631 RepID=A0A917CBJ6_9HYPH|nr:SDR family NAD(P)-dependent oxidoreductase [Azorhizobium oxalatiphilum]GGF80229.1 short-chain dehydrogenase [Azorhizobium oxalatiphilum]
MTAGTGITVITGASSGIGAALAEELARKGHRLALLGRNAERLEAVAERCRAAGVPCTTHSVDIRNRTALQDVLAGIESAAPIGLFIANAGILDGRRDGETVESYEAAERVLDTNLISTISALHLVLPGMRARREGRLLLISSLAAFAPLPDAPAYSAAKAGLLSYGLALREALREEGISVCVACPGYVTSAMSARHLGHRPGEIAAEDAARRILSALDGDRALSGFPFSLYWGSRLSLLVPAFIRRLGMKGLRFRVGG